MSRQKAITAFFCEKYGDYVQHNQCTSSESVNLAESAEPGDLDEDYSTQTIQSLLRSVFHLLSQERLTGKLTDLEQKRMLVAATTQMLRKSKACNMLWSTATKVNISTILQLLLTLPVGSSSCERSFCSLRRLKTWSCTSMANARLNGLALAYIHKPTEIDGSSVLKRCDAAGHRWIALAFSKGEVDGKNFYFSYF